MQLSLGLNMVSHLNHDALWKCSRRVPISQNGKPKSPSDIQQQVTNTKQEMCKNAFSTEHAKL